MTALTRASRPLSLSGPSGDTIGLSDQARRPVDPACHHAFMSALDAAARIGLLLVPMAVMGLAFVIVPILLTQRRQWSATSGLLAMLAAATCAAFVVVSAQRADENPGGGAVGGMGTDVPALLLPPLLFGVLALIAGRRWPRPARERGELDPPNGAGLN